MVTTSLVNELLSKALDENCSVPNLVNHAFVVAKKLKVYGFVNWLRLEMNGYEYEYEMPTVRRCIVEVRTLTRNRWIPIVFEQEEDAKNLSEVFMNLPISTLVSWVDEGKSEIELPFSPEYQKDLMVQLDIHQPISRFMSVHQVKFMIDAVKTRIIDWALQLEEEGIVGEGMTFSKAEQEKASHIININTINGPMIGSQIQQGTKESKQEQNIDYKFIQETLEELKRELPHMGLPSEEQSTVATMIQSVSPLIQAQNPSMKGVIRELFSSIRNIAEGVTASQTHSMLKDKLDMIISFFS